MPDKTWQVAPFTLLWLRSPPSPSGMPGTGLCVCFWRWHSTLTHPAQQEAAQPSEPLPCKDMPRSHQAATAKKAVGGRPDAGMAEMGGQRSSRAASASLGPGRLEARAARERGQGVPRLRRTPHWPGLLTSYRGLDWTGLDWRESLERGRGRPAQCSTTERG